MLSDKENRDESEAVTKGSETNYTIGNLKKDVCYRNRACFKQERFVVNCDTCFE